MRKFPFTKGLSAGSGGSVSIGGMPGFRTEVYSVAISIHPAGANLNNTITVSGLVDDTGVPGTFPIFINRNTTSTQNFPVPMQGITLPGHGISFDVEPSDGDLNGITIIVSGAFVEADGV